MKSFLKKSALRSASCLQALSITGLAIGAVAISAPAAAQDYTAGAVGGTVTDASGNPVGGATVTITSTEQGFSRTVTTNDSGSFRFATLPTGNYTIKVASSGNADFTATDVKVLAGQTANLPIALAAAGNEIVVTAAAIQKPFSGTTTGVNVDVAELVKTVPINRDLTSVVLLAPGTSRGDTAFGNLASIGGSSVAENAYYVNGLNTTNFDNYLGSAEVPFEFYRTVEVKSGGYPAEFGRATGGIVNATTKSGTNDFMAAVHLNYEPDWAHSDGKNLMTCSAPGVCSNSTNRAFDRDSRYSAIVEAGGPIIKDRLFAYGLVEFQRHTYRITSRASDTAYEYRNDDPFWGVKLDAYPIDNQHLEFTIWDTRNTLTRNDRAYSEDASGNPSAGVSKSVTDFNGGGVNYVGKYTGQFTDWFTLSAAYGRMRDRFDNVGVAGATTLPASRNLGSALTCGPTSCHADPNGVGFAAYFGPQNVIGTSSPYSTQRKFWRADADFFFSLLGDHHIRLGYDQENNTLTEAAIRNGGTYEHEHNLITDAAFNYGNGGGGYYYRIISPTVVQLDYFNSLGAFKAKNRAWYAEDEWKPIDRLTLNLGVRRDDFLVDNADGESFAKLKKNYAPRLGLTYDLWPDKQGKLFGSYGWYYLPFASNTAFRMTGAEMYFRERWNFAGMDANGIPNLTTQVSNNGAYQNTCPFKLTPMSSGLNCSVTGDGSVPPSDAALSHNLKATRESEWIVGYQHKLEGWNLGITYTHRNLDRTAEDMAIDKAVNNWCAANGIAGCSSTWTGFNQYVIANPGKDLTVNLLGLDGREVTFTKEDLAAIGFGEAKRTYDAVELTFDHPWNGKWALGGSYTWSKSKGNSEGFVQSDFGQDDAGITQDFDQPGFLVGAYGYLPNDRRHRIKLHGAYGLTDAFIVGANARIESPRHLSCFGYYPDPDAYENGYGAASHFCGGVESPRGTAQRSDWYTQLDLSARYNIEIPTGQTVTFRVDVFNALNAQAVQKRNEIGDSDYDTANNIFVPNASYHQPTLYQTPRYVRFGADIAF